MNGSSNTPYINSSEKGLFEPIDFDDVRIGDILVFCNSDKCDNLIAHQLIGTETYFIMKGLNTTLNETERVPINYFKYKLIRIEPKSI